MGVGEECQTAAHQPAQPGWGEPRKTWEQPSPFPGFLMEKKGPASHQKRGSREREERGERSTP